MGDKVIPGTVHSGQNNIRSQIDSSQQEWASLESSVKNSIDLIENKLKDWSEFEALKENCLSWLRETDSKLHLVDLKPNAVEKNSQLEYLKLLQGEIRAKDLEIDRVTEHAQQLTKGIGARSSQISELGVKYQQVSHKVKDLVSRWQQYVNTHQDFDSQTQLCQNWLDETKNKIAYCSDLSSSSQKDLENKLATIQDLLLTKDEGSVKIQNLVELAQVVLANTAPSGHEAINQALVSLQEQWSILASKMVETKATLDDSLTKWSDLLDQTQGLIKTIEWMEEEHRSLRTFQGSIQEKRAQLDRIKNVEEKVRCEKIEVDNLKSKAVEMLECGQQSQAANEAKAILDRFDSSADKIKKLLAEREAQFKDHKSYKEAYEELHRWLMRAQEKVPQLKQRPLSDKLAVESFSAPLDSLLNKQAQGEVLLDTLEHSAEVILPSTSPEGQDVIKNDNRALRESFERLFRGEIIKKKKISIPILPLSNPQILQFPKTKLYHRII